MPLSAQIGDWGREGAFNQSEVAAVMGELAYTRAPQFVISTGDNFYQSAHAPNFSFLRHLAPARRLTPRLSLLIGSL